MGLSLLDEMISRGNRVAQLRKSEIELLEEFAQPLHRQNPQSLREMESPNHHQHEDEHEDERHHLVTPTSTDDNIHNPDPVPYRSSHANHDFHNLDDAGMTLPPITAVPVQAPHDDDLLFDWRDFGVSLNQMLSAAEQLNSEQNLVDADADHDGIRADLWLWSSD